MFNMLQRVLKPDILVGADDVDDGVGVELNTVPDIFSTVLHNTVHRVESVYCCAYRGLARVCSFPTPASSLRWTTAISTVCILYTTDKINQSIFVSLT